MIDTKTYSEGYDEGYQAVTYDDSAVREFLEIKNDTPYEEGRRDGAEEGYRDFLAWRGIDEVVDWVEAGKSKAEEERMEALKQFGEVEMVQPLEK